MPLNRRDWLQQSTLAFAGIGLAPISTFALPHVFKKTNQENNPLRLCYNENPYGPSEATRKAMMEKISESNRYGWEFNNQLITAIAKKNDMKDENIILGCGSTEILDLTVRYAAAEKGSFLASTPTFATWQVTAANYGLKKIEVPLTVDKHNDLKAILNAIKADTRLIYLCNPNNPTGTICEREDIISFIKAIDPKIAIMVDEAYLDFSGQKSVSNLVTAHKNLIVVKTFSKIRGMASARIGYGIGHSETIEQLSHQQTWSGGGVSLVSAAGAIAALADDAFTGKCYVLNDQARKFTISQLETLDIKCIPSYSNFIYFSLANYKNDYLERLKTNNIMGTGVWEESGKWSRISIGTMDEMQKLINALR